MEKGKTPPKVPSQSGPSETPPFSKVSVFEIGIGSETKILRLNKNRVVIGAVTSADIFLNESGVSPIHAVVEIPQNPANGVATLYDLASEAGVKVNGQKVVTQVLNNGDQIQIGPFQIKFSVEELKKVIREEPRSFDSGDRKLFVNPKEDLRPLILEDESQVQEIFDYRPSQKQALEVVMSWNGTILGVEHFVTEDKVTLGGTQRDHFPLPPSLSSDSYPLAVKVGNDFTIQFDSRMSGVIQRQGQLLKLDQVKDQGTATSHGFQLVLGRNDFAKVSLGGIDFYLSYTAAPPRLKRQRLTERDPLLWRIVITSLLFTAFLVMVLLKTQVPERLEAEELPDRIATILYQPEKYSQIRPPVSPKPEPQKTEPKPEPKKEPPKKVVVDLKPKAEPPKKAPPKEMNVGTQKKTVAQPKPVLQPRGQSAAKEGAGERAKGAEGTRGKPTAPDRGTPQTAAKRPSPRGGSGSGTGASQVQDEGNLDFLKGATDKITNLLGNSGAKLGSGGNKIEGFGGFDSRGKGGLALSGEGIGGGGRADSLGGLSDRGRGGGRVGTGLGAAGTGGAIVGGKSRVVLRTGTAEETVVMGAIDAEAIRAAIYAHRDEFRLCYERELNAGQPSLSGRVGTSFVIGPRGQVTEAGVISSTLGNENVERCILKVIRRIEFPAPRGGGIVEVRYPFKYASK